ncbi:MAG: hypothetical protein EB078_05100 [Proteobacteria bacterium]|nr:hypothetical protein [Pseudomonadota bacterium]NDD04262.1 hypothetical protein [Pseudomonadota bacterium]NDG26784.1 hypothetical protein [Pseudomonadota bacterium]
MRELQLVSSREEFQWLLVVVMGYFLSLLPESFLWLGCLGCILIVGVPHGALDIYLIWSESKGSLRRSCLLLGSYIVLVVLAIILWRISSELFWFLFFIAAVYHFGTSDDHPELLFSMLRSSLRRWLWVYSRGLVLVFAPAAFHSEKILKYIKPATSSDFAESFIAVAPFLLGYGLVVYFALSAVSFRNGFSRNYRFLVLKQAVSLLLMVVLFAVSDPLVGFCLYFCCHHSLNHGFRVFGRNKNNKFHLLLLANLFTLPIIPMVLWIKIRMSEEPSHEKMVISCFVSIAALTFPHLFVVKKLHADLRRSNKTVPIT